MAKARMAGKALEALKWLFKDQGAGEIALRVIPDVGFGVLEAALTPGDLGDKILAGGGTALGGVSGGLLLGKLGRGNTYLTQGLTLQVLWLVISADVLSLKPATSKRWRSDALRAVE